MNHVKQTEVKYTSQNYTRTKQKNGVQEIKDTVMKEIHELRKQIETSRAVVSATAESNRKAMNRNWSN